MSNENGKMEITPSKPVIAISCNNNFGSICSSTYVDTACKVLKTYSEVSKISLKPCIQSNKKQKLQKMLFA